MLIVAGAVKGAVSFAMSVNAICMLLIVVVIGAVMVSGSVELISLNSIGLVWVSMEPLEEETNSRTPSKVEPSKEASSRTKRVDDEEE